MSSWSNCPSAARLQKIIDERPLGGRAGTKPSENALKNTSAKDLEKTTGNAMKKRSVNALKKRSRNALENGSGYASEETSRNVSGKTSGDALEKETVKPADLDNDNNSSQGVSITNESVDANGGGPKGETEVQRLRRRAVSTGYDEEYSLVVNVERKRTRPQKLRSLIKAAMKLGVEEMQYPSCDSVVTDLKCRINIQAAPEVLVVLLARFGWDASTQPVDKIHGIVKFGPRLDLSRYYLPNEPLRKQSLRYQLVGVVSHAGNLTGGHYTATVRQPDKGLGSTSPAGKKTKRQSSSDAADASAAEKWKLAHDTRVTD
ncbi:ubiquitin-specific protease ubp2 [Xylographa opegraphella]|nr:ubiquitin-specific protease ubp2 [Xylographa opegraphella]